MKRKLFTLLAAFVVLVTFQANAQTTAGGWYWIDTKSPTDDANPDNPAGSLLYPWAPANNNVEDVLDGALRYAGVGSAIVNKKGDTHTFFPRGDYGSYFRIARVSTTMTFTIQSRNPDKTVGPYLTLSYGGATIQNFEFVQFGAISGTPSTPAAGRGAFPADKGGYPTSGQYNDFWNYGYEPGGYVCAPTTNTNGGDSPTSERIFVVVNQKTGALSLMTTKQIDDANTAADDDNTNTLPYYTRLWAKAYAIGGHWATIDDFKNTDFVKFGLGNQYLYAHDNYDANRTGAKYDAFRVDAVGFIQSDKNVMVPYDPFYTTYTNGQKPSTLVSTAGGNTVVKDISALWYDSKIVGQWQNEPEVSSTLGLQKLNIKPNSNGKEVGDDPNNNNWVLPLFTIRSADDSCKYLSVKKENQIFSSLEVVRTAYSDLLELRNYGEYYDQSNTDQSKWHFQRIANLDKHAFLQDFYTSSHYAASRPARLQNHDIYYKEEIERSVKSQTFAIWIDADGTMSIYPLGAYVYNPTLRHKNMPIGEELGRETDANWTQAKAEERAKGFQINESLLNGLWDKHADGNPTGLSFKIGTRIDASYPTMKDFFCLTPVQSIPASVYANGLFTENNWTEYNVIPEGRYFFMEVKGVNAAGKIGQMDRKHVLSVQTVEDYGTGEFYKKIVLVPKEDLLKPNPDAAGPSDYSVYPLDSVIMSAHWEVQKVADNGYRFINELGDTLQYDPGAGGFGFGLTATSGIYDYTQYSIGPNPEDDRKISALTALAGGVVNFDHRQFPYSVFGNPLKSTKSVLLTTRAASDSLALYSSYYEQQLLNWVNIISAPQPNNRTDKDLAPTLTANRIGTRGDVVSGYNWYLPAGSSDYVRPLYFDAWKTIKKKDDPEGYVYLRLNVYGNKTAIATTYKNHPWVKYQVNLDTLNDYGMDTETHSAITVNGQTYTRASVTFSRARGIYNTGWYSAPSTISFSPSNEFAGASGFRSPRVSSIKLANADEYYYQKDLIANPRDKDIYPNVREAGITDPQSALGAIYGGTCTNGLAVRFVPVEYQKDGKIYNDASDPSYYNNDSLTAYLYKNGVYNITEAVDLQLNVGITKLNGGNPDYERSNVASMVGVSSDHVSVEPVGEERDAILDYEYLGYAVTPNSANYGSAYHIKNEGNTSAATQKGFELEYMRADALYSDPYKWHYVKYDDMYMVFDTINPLATTQDLMYGFRFKKVDKINATPVRFYQPLVGDKINGNYIVQFIVPTYYYALDRTGKINYAASYRRFNGPGATSGVTHTPATTDNFVVAGAVRYVKFNKQTGPLYVTKDVKTKATRLKFTEQGPPPCGQEFVTTDYLMDNGLYRLPLTANLWDAGESTEWFISGTHDGAATEQTTFGKAEKLRITLADTLHAYNSKYNALIINGNTANPADARRSGIGFYRDASPYDKDNAEDLRGPEESPRYYGYDPLTTGAVNRDDYGYESATTDNRITKDVQLFYIQNAEGQFLTVIDETAATQTLDHTTNPDVYGTKLAWRAKYTYTNAEYAAGSNSDLRPLQMFAIHGCLTSGDAPHGEFVLLPAASYVMDYATKRPVGIMNNSKLGIRSSGGYSTVTGAFRTSMIGRDPSLKTMIVVPGNSDISMSATADEFKFTPDRDYAGPFCYHNFIQNVTKQVEIGGKDYYGYYGADGYYTRADSTKPIMHWTWSPVQGKKSLYTLSTELKEWRGQTVKNEMLKEQYYFAEQTGSDFENNKKGVFEVISRQHPELRNIIKVEITCLDDKDHAPVCDNQPVDGCYNNYFRFCDGTLITSEFGIIEAVHNDRYVWSSDDNINAGRTIAECGILATGETAEYLRIEKSYVRPVSEHHTIPYYHIIRRINKQDYYLQVKYDAAKNPIGVEFTRPSDSDREKLRDIDKYPTALPGYKFCFPYRLDENGLRMHPEEDYKNKPDLYQVFIQSLDTGNIAQTMMKAALLKISHDSHTILPVQLPEEDILTIDYSSPTKLDATTWFFGDNGGSAYEWVELVGAREKGNTEGWLSGVSDGLGEGNLFVVASGKTPNYGVLDAYSKTPSMKLTFEFEGDTTLGSYTMRPIWYYRIKNAEGQFLTNTAALAETNSSYLRAGRPYAVFGGWYPNDDSNLHIHADAAFDQTFGLRHIPLDLQPEGKENQYFWVVSRVDFKNANYSEYYYLSSYANQLVFSKADLNDPTAVDNHAVMFQLGTVAEDGQYTDVDAVADGAFKAYGVEGAVKVLNATGVVELYTVDGRKFKTVTTTGEEQTITAPNGVVIVKNGANVSKVIVK